MTNNRIATCISDVGADEIARFTFERDADFSIQRHIIQQLANMNLIDEYELVFVPVVLGSGKYLFRDVKMAEMKLLEAQSFNNGLVSLRYRPA